MTRHLLAVWGMAFFLAVMAGMNAWNCWLLWREKQVKGISPLTVLFRSGANVWQVWFLFQLGQWAAFGAAVPATGLNLAWVLMAFYYQRWPSGCQYPLMPKDREARYQALFAGAPPELLPSNVAKTIARGPTSVTP